jgi:hypothetical protein
MPCAVRETSSENRFILATHQETDFLLDVAPALLADFNFSTSLKVSERNFPGGTSSVSGPYRTRLIFST